MIQWSFLHAITDQMLRFQKNMSQNLHLGLSVCLSVWLSRIAIHYVPEPLNIIETFKILNNIQPEKIFSLIQLD